MATSKIITIKAIRYARFGEPTERTLTGTLTELIDQCNYTLSCGASYAHEKGNKKINLAPKSAKSLVTNLNNALDNAAANGCSNMHYELVD